MGDNSDAFPTDAMASVDNDEDGYPDLIIGDATELSNGIGLDKFPSYNIIAVDDDNDGYADNINDGFTLEGY